MEGFDLEIHKGRKPVFADAPEEFRVSLFGNPYIHLRGFQGGDLFFTRYGWEVAHSLLPQFWFTGEQFWKKGRALAGATGAVYRVPVPGTGGREVPIIVKFSRFGQDVGVTLAGGENEFGSLQEQLLEAEFLPPFEEFANLESLRAKTLHTLATNLPLAIYSPPTRHLSWQLGRKPHLKSLFEKNLLQTQTEFSNSRTTPCIKYDWERIYILLYSWLDGVDAEQAAHSGMITREEMFALSRSTAKVMSDCGWTVLDHKARHVILRPDLEGRQILKKGPHPIPGLVDFELLVPIRK